MKKTGIVVATIVVALIVAGLLGPWYTGRTTNQQLDAAVAAINRQGTLQASYTRTRTGWFGQRGDLVLVPLLASLRKFDPHGTRPLSCTLISPTARFRSPRGGTVSPCCRRSR